jgi:hypothetical protein
MSLDLFAHLPIQKLNNIECYCTPVNIDHVSIYTSGAIHLGNITHNLADMATHVSVDYGVSLYDCLWRSQYCCEGKLDSLRILWKKGLEILDRDRERLKRYNPSNGFGTHDDLIEFVRLVLINSEKLVGIGVTCESDV